jgi:hypothetical protein
VLVCGENSISPEEFLGWKVQWNEVLSQRYLFEEDQILHAACLIQSMDGRGLSAWIHSEGHQDWCSLHTQNVLRKIDQWKILLDRNLGWK